MILLHTHAGTTHAASIILRQAKKDNVHATDSRSSESELANGKLYSENDERRDICTNNADATTLR